MKGVFQYMGKRVYGEASAPKKKLTDKSVAIVAVASLACLEITASVIAVANDSKKDNKYSSVDDCVIGFIDAIDESDENTMISYLHPSLRDVASPLSTLNISELRRLEDDFDITISDVKVNDVTDISDDVISLKEGIFDTYNVDIDIKEARKVSAEAKTVYSLEECGDEMSSVVNFNLVCINSDSKWYVYSGDYSNMESDAVQMADSPVGDIKIPASEEVTYPPVIKNRLDLDYYDGVANDLFAGKLTIDDAELVMPADLSDLKSFMKMVPDEDRVTLMPFNEYHSVPVIFTNNSYSSDCVDITVVNMSDATASVIAADESCKIVSFYIGQLRNGQNYPDVYLPGNITFGSSYSDVMSMYGQPSNYIETDQLIRHEDCLSVYQYDLDNSNNHLYLEFDNESNLVAIQYYYSDLTPEETVPMTVETSVSEETEASDEEN